jgi:predicted nucleotidyltransferase component of viral defense system
MKNTAASIRTRLSNLAKKENLSFQLIILRFLHERFLYRLSVSRFSGNFLLKGGVLLYALEGSKTRSTLDIDFLGRNIANNSTTIREAIREICTFSYPNDCVWFNTASIETLTIIDHDKYNGIRIFIESGFETIRQRLQIDIGFGDVVTPAPITIDYPLLLADLYAPVLLVYSIETIIAEKFQAMIELSAANSRMKDFYDVYKIIKCQGYSKIALLKAIENTFKWRMTPYSENHALFTNDFANNMNRQAMWKAFIKKTELEKELLFPVVMQTITEELKPYWEMLNK